MTDQQLPTRAYDLLDSAERDVVDDYVRFIVGEQHRKRERIINALHVPIASEYVRRSRGVLHKPLVLAAVSERIREEAGEQDISPDRLIREYVCLAHSNIDDFVQRGNFGQVEVKDLSTISREKLAAVKSIESKPTTYGMHVKVTMHDKQPAMNKVAELMGLIAPERPPALQEYIRPPQAEQQVLDAVPERAYQELLESVSGG